MLTKKPIILSKTFHDKKQENSIIVTRLGLQKLADYTQWGEQSVVRKNKNKGSQDEQKKFSEHYRDSIRVKKRNILGKVNTTFLNGNNQTQKQNLFLNSMSVEQQREWNTPEKKKSNRRSFNRKIFTKYQKWNETQKSFEKIVKKQIDRRILQKEKEIQWPQITSQYKKTISNIFKNWEDQNHLEDFRTKERLKKIYIQKYQTDHSKNKQKILSFKQRSFLEPRRSNFQMETNNRSNKTITKKQELPLFNNSVSEKENLKVYYKLINLN